MDNFYIDVSGQPYDKTVIGAVSINNYKFSSIYKDLRNKNPKLLRRKRKASNLSSEELLSVLTSMQKHDISMNVSVISNNDWFRLKETFKNRHKWIERCFSAAYYLPIHYGTKENWNVQVVVCNENFMDTDFVMDSLKYLGRSNKRFISVSKGYVSQIDQLRLSDFIAGAIRKIPMETIKKEIPSLNIHMLLDPKYSYFLNRVFEK